MPYGGSLPPSPSWRLAEKLYDGNGALRLKRAENGDTARFEGEKGCEFQVQCDSEARDMYSQFRVIHGRTCEVLREHKLTGWKCHFTDHRPCGWRKVRCVQAASGRQAYYEGRFHDEKLVMKITPKGNFYYYEGERKRERLVRVWHDKGGANGLAHDFLAFFEGEPKQERMVRQEQSNGDVVHFDGPHPYERKYKRVFASGTVQHFLGATGQERLYREEKASGVKLYFVGDKGREHKVREDHPTGTIRLFAGERWREYMTMEIGFGENYECTVSQCDAPSQGASRIRRTLFPNGTMLVYPSLADEPNAPPHIGVAHLAHPRRMITPDGRLCKEIRGGLGWKRVHEDDDSGSMGWEQRKRFKNVASEMWSELERLAETGGVNENALIAMGTHFKKLTSELD